VPPAFIVTARIAINGLAVAVPELTVIVGCVEYPPPTLVTVNSGATDEGSDHVLPFQHNSPTEVRTSRREAIHDNKAGVTIQSCLMDDIDVPDIASNIYITPVVVTMATYLDWFMVKW
jgi:hypothetical protein